MRRLKAVGALLLLAALLVGVPALLLAWGTPLALLDVQWRTALSRPDDGTIILGLLSLAGWLAWLVLACTFVAEALSLLSRRRWVIRMPGAGWLQPVVGALIAMALLPTVSGHAEEPAPPSASQTTLPKEVPVPVHVPNPDVRGMRTYVVQPGDELWGVAERELGSGRSWRDIVSCNPGMTTDTTLVAGTTIRIPRDALAAGPAAVDHITVERGDTLWELAQEHLDDAHRWPELYVANRHIIVDPDEIDIGWRLALPLGPAVNGTTHPARQIPEPTVPTPSVPAPPAPTPPVPAPPSPTPPVSAPSVPAPRVAVRESPGPTPEKISLPAPPSRNTDAEPMPEPALAEQEDPSDPSLEFLGPVGGVLAAGLVAGVVARRHVQLLHRQVGRRIATLTPTLQRFFTALVQRSRDGSTEPPGVQPAAVVVGWDDGPVLVDLEEQRCTLLQGDDEHTAAMAATIVTSLLCADWSATVELVVVEPPEDWSSALDDPRLSGRTTGDAALADLQRLCARRRVQLGQQDLATVRADNDRADAWQPVVFVFCQPLHSAHLAHINDSLGLGAVGVSVVAATTAPVPHALTITVDTPSRARRSDTATTFQPQLLHQPARRAVIGLFAAAADPATEPAPWWRDDAPPVATELPSAAKDPIKDDAMSAWSPPPHQPTLLLLGPVELINTRGSRPTRAVGQCMEYCAWLLLHPGATPTMMVRELLVAEGTRRSNMSRLRTWLGEDPRGDPYLPDAYSGRITLAAAVTSDWERFQALLAGGVNNSSTPLLRQALALVRGRVLDSVAFQWPWASSWLTDMLSMITDAAVVLADRCMGQQDFTGALWAIDQGLLAVGDDETLAVRRIQVLAGSGHHDEVDTAVTHLTRAARAENRDLTPESIQRIQHALHLTMSGVAGP